jgi:hypothetical protein
MNIKRLLKRRKLGNRGIAFVWLQILIALVVVMMAYIPFDSIIRIDIYNAAIEAGGDPIYLNNIVACWRAFPFVYIFCLFLYGLIRSQKNEYDTGWQ